MVKLQALLNVAATSKTYRRDYVKKQVEELFGETIDISVIKKLNIIQENRNVFRSRLGKQIKGREKENQACSENVVVPHQEI